MATEFGKFGTAADVARIKMDNLTGDIEQFRGSLDTALIGAGSGGNKFLRDITQDATGAVNAFNNLAPSTQESALKVVAVGGAAALGVAGLAKLAVGAAATRAALVGLNLTSATAAAGFGKLAAAAGPAVVALLAVGAASSALSRSWHAGTQPRAGHGVYAGPGAAGGDVVEVAGRDRRRRVAKQLGGQALELSCSTPG